MLGNECVMSPPVEKLKQNGNLGSILSSPAPRKNENPVASTENRPGQSQLPGSSPDAGIHSVEENVTPDVKSQFRSKYYACPPSAGSLKHLHRTPPTRSKNIVVSNPFDVGIADRLPFPMYSPSVFARVVSPSQVSILCVAWPAWPHCLARSSRIHAIISYRTALHSDGPLKTYPASIQLILKSFLPISMKKWLILN